MLWLVVPTSAVGFRLAIACMRKPALSQSVLAVGVLAVVALWGHAAWDATSEVAVNVAASALLASAHWRNFREVRRSTGTHSRRQSPRAEAIATACTTPPR